MDPLSITASILTVVSAGSTIGKGLKKIISARRLPDILLQLNNEVADIQYVVQDVDDLLQQQRQITQEDRGPLPSHASLTSALEHIKRTLLALESLIAYELTIIDSRDGRSRLDWIAWLRVESKVARLKDDIRTDRIRLSSALSLLTSSTSLGLHLGLHDQMRRLCLESKTAEFQINQSDQTFRGQQSEQRLVLQDSQQAGISQSLQKENGPEAPQTHTSTTLSGLGPSQSSQLDAVLTPYPVCFDLFRGLCEQNCSCACHNKRGVRSPSNLDAIFGSLWIGYSAQPWRTQTCDSTDCRGRSTFITYTYAFPQWLSNRMVSLRIAYNQSRGPELCLRVVRVRSSTENVFQVAMMDRSHEVTAIHYLEHLLKHGEGSVVDVNEYGLSALQLALDCVNYETAAFLIKAGSDVFFENSLGLCAYTMYWKSEIARQRTSGHERDSSSLSTLLGDKPRLSHFGFPPLTRAYVGSSREDFDRVLSITPRSAIDDVDATGSTTLSWAVRCSDCDSVKRLLLCGSNPEHVDPYGRTLLHQAVYNDDLAVIELLLAAKANVNQSDIQGETAMHVAPMMRHGTTIMECLLSNGASIESQNRRGYRPLHWAVQSNIPTNLQFLLEEGADINAANQEGSTGLIRGVMFNTHKTLSLLLREEALRYDGKDYSGYSLLYYAAAFGDLETIHLLQSARQLKKLNLDGDDALDWAQWRRDNNEARSLGAGKPSDEDPLAWYSAFEELWNSIAEAQQQDLNGGSEGGFIEGERVDDDDDDDDEGQVPWEDAPETLDGPL